MKKFSIVLLALLLAGGFAFAATIDWTLSGDASSGVKFDFDSDYYGMFYGMSADLDGEISAETEGGGDIYGTISVGFVGDYDEAGGAISYDSLSAAIMYEDIKVAFGSSDSVGPWYNEARGYSSIDLDASGSANQAGVTTAFNASTADNLGQGVAVTVDKITVGGVYVSDATVVDYSVYGSYADSFDGLELKATAGFANEDLFAGAKVSTNVEDWTVFVASDVEYLNATSAFGMDATVGVSGAVEGVSLGAEAFYDLNSEVLAAFAKAGIDLSEDLSLSARLYTDDVLNNMTLGTSVTLTNETMIDGASLNLKYANSDFLASNMGTVSAYATVVL